MNYLSTTILAASLVVGGVAHAQNQSNQGSGAQTAPMQTPGATGNDAQAQNQGSGVQPMQGQGASGGANTTMQAQNQGMQDWDTDSDGSLSRDEWTAGMGTTMAFGQWDTDADGSVGAMELASGLFDQFDADGDGNLTSAEWDDGFDNRFGEQAVDLDFAAWDANSNDQLSEDEFTQQFETAGLFDQLRSSAGLDTSADGIAEGDFSNAMFDWTDRNDDDMIGTDEGNWSSM